MLEEKAALALAALAEAVDNSELASIKKVTTGIVRIINDPASSARDLKAIVEVDPPLTAKVLKIANSAYYSSRRHISDIEEAVIWIGFDKLKEIALSQKVCEVFHSRDVAKGFSRQMLWSHSVATAVTGKAIYRMEFGERGEDIYAAGLLHDLGIITADQFLTADFEAALLKTKESKINLHEAELAQWGFTHADIGRAVAERWQLPESLCESIGFHHDPTDAPEPFRKLADTLYVANDMAHDLHMGFKTLHFPDKDMFQACLARLNVSQVALELIVESVRREIRKMQENGIL